jgi:hypothetical protein
MRVCMAGEGSGSDLGAAGGSDNEAGGGEMENTMDERRGLERVRECGNMEAGRHGAQRADRGW